MQLFFFILEKLFQNPLHHHYLILEIGITGKVGMGQRLLGRHPRVRVHDQKPLKNIYGQRVGPHKELGEVLARMVRHRLYVGPSLCGVDREEGGWSNPNCGQGRRRGVVKSKFHPSPRGGIGGWEMVRQIQEMTRQAYYVSPAFQNHLSPRMLLCFWLMGFRVT